jgi:hypothetical protein
MQPALGGVMKYDHHTGSWAAQHERGLKIRGWGALVTALVLLAATAAVLSAPVSAKPRVSVAASQNP